LKAEPGDDELLRAEAEKGDAQSQFSFAYALRAGYKVPQDYVEAAKWFRKAIEPHDSGHELSPENLAIAQVYLGIAYDTGKGVPQDNVEAMKLYRRAAEKKGVTGGLAEFRICLNYMTAGNSVPKDNAEAAKWLREAAEQGYPDAQWMICEFSMNGKFVPFVPMDTVEGLKWLLKAAEQGQVKAESVMGVSYYFGHNGVSQDYAEALKWFQKAARQGNSKAQCNLGLMYAKGQSVPKDEIEGLAWLNIAASSSDQNYVDIRTTMEKHLGLEATLLAQQRSKEIAKEIEANKPQ
jgi:TPR repeat protein